MDTASALSFADKMQRLLQRRAEQQQLPAGYMRCPLNPTHEVPIAAIVTHLEKTHQQDVLSLHPNAMYGVGTYARRRKFLESQLHLQERREKEDRCYHRQRYRKRSRHGYLRGGSNRSRGSTCSTGGTTTTTSASRSSSCSTSNSKSYQRCRHGRSRYEDSYSDSKSSRSLSMSQSSLPAVSHKRVESRMSPERNNRGPEAPYMYSTSSHYTYSDMKTGMTSPGGMNWSRVYPPPSSPPILPPTTFDTLPTPESTVLLGRYGLGHSISSEHLMNYLLQFGPLVRCEVQPQYGTFTVMYTRYEHAYQCLQMSYPLVTIDGVAVQLQPALPTTVAPFTVSPSSAAAVANTGLSVNRTSYVYPTHAHEQRGQYHNYNHNLPPPPPPPPPPVLPPVLPSVLPPSTSVTIPPPVVVAPSASAHQHGTNGVSVITVGGKLVGVTEMNGNSSAHGVVSARSATVKPPSGVIIAALKGKSDKSGETILEEQIWKDFSRFGAVRNIIIAGPRVMVEYESEEGVERAAHALRDDADIFPHCSCC